MRRILNQIAVLLSAVWLIVLSTVIQANTPDPAILKELERRLTRSPECLPDCASLERLNIQVTADSLTINARIHSIGRFGVPLPTPSIFAPDLTVLVDGEKPPITRETNGTLMALLSEGISEVVIRSSTSSTNRFDLELPLIPSTIELTNNAWRTSGIWGGELTGSSIGFNRVEQQLEVTSDQLVQEQAKPYVSVARDIAFGIEILVETKVRRLAPRTGAFSVEIPLLPDEEVLETEHPMENGVMTVNFGRTESTISWKSRFDNVSEITLTAPPISARSEEWTFVGSDHWHWDYEGLEPVLTRSDSTTFWPRADESLKIELQKPIPVEGAFSTIESATASYTVGTRLLDGSLLLNINATQGSQLTVDLPEGSRITEVRARDVQIPAPKGSTIILPISPGSSIYRVNWQIDKDISTIFRSPEIKLDLPARNVNVNVEFQGNRWAVFLNGPLLGPAVLFWGVVVVILLIACLLTLLPNFPLTRLDAIVLSLGATLSNVWVLLLIAVWFAAIWVRSQRDLSQLSLMYYQVMQVALSLLSGVAILALVWSIPRALLGSPDMQIVGNESSATFFRWYTDYVDGVLPQVSVVSLPNWIYLLLMLAWSLWLAYAIVKWSIATWKTLSTPDYWRNSDPASEIESDDTVSQPS